MLAAAQIRADPESYAPYLIDFGLEHIQFCEQFVLEMGASAEEVSISALSRALGVPIEVGQLRNHKVAQGEVEFVAYKTVLATADSDPIVLLNRWVTLCM
ncbi:hypothetical protein HWV62_12214 [Athelia sp. TMB]|nr:hypothetical protein HWV62_12214 [Athelia sp. TMB]